MGIEKFPINAEVKANGSSEKTKHEKATSEHIDNSIDKELNDQESVNVKEDILDKFSEKFGITTEDLKKVEGFSDLTEGQKHLALVNLKQWVLGEVELKAIKNLEAQKAENKYSGKLLSAKGAKSLFHQVRLGLFKKNRLTKFSQESLENIKYKEEDLNKIKDEKEKEKKEIEVKQAKEGLFNVLEGVVKRASKKDVEYNEENDEINVNYLSSEELTDLEISEEQVKKFNKSAMEYSRMPASWGSETNKLTNKKEYKRYQKAKRKFEEARKELGDGISEMEGNEKEKNKAFGNVLRKVKEISDNVQIDQFLNSNPDVEKALLEIEDSDLVSRALQNAKSEKGVALITGAFSRNVSKVTLGTLGASGAMVASVAIPVAATLGAGFGWWRGKIRGKEDVSGKETEIGKKSIKEINEIKEERRGYLDELKKLKEVKKEERSEENESKIVELESLLEIKEKKGERNFVTADAMASKIEGIIDRVEAERDKNKKAELFKQLNRRLNYTNIKLEDGLVNFGDSGEIIGNSIKLMDQIGVATVYIEKNKNIEESENQEKLEKMDKNIEERLEKYLKFKESTISDEQKDIIKEKARNGALLAGGLAMAAAGIRELGEGLGWWGENDAEVVKESLSESSSEGSSPPKNSSGEVLKKVVRETHSTNEVLEVQDSLEPDAEKKRAFAELFRNLSDSDQLKFLENKVNNLSSDDKESLFRSIGSSNVDGDGQTVITRGIASPGQVNSLPGADQTVLHNNDVGATESVKVVTPTKSENFKITTSKLKVESGDSIWSMAKKYLETNDKYNELLESNIDNKGIALETYNIDRVKDEIVNNPEEYGFKKDMDWTKMSKKDLEGIEWQKAFNKAFPEKNITDELSEKQVDSIIASNKNEVAKAKLSDNEVSNLSNKVNDKDFQEFKNDYSKEVTIDDRRYTMEYSSVDEDSRTSTTMTMLDSKGNVIEEGVVDNNNFNNQAVADFKEKAIKTINKRIEEFTELIGKNSGLNTDVLLNKYNISIYDGISDVEKAEIVFLNSEGKDFEVNKILKIFNIMDEYNLSKFNSGRLVSEFIDKYDVNNFSTSQYTFIEQFNFGNIKDVLPDNSSEDLFSGLFNVEDSAELSNLSSTFDNLDITYAGNGYKKIEISDKVGGGLFSNTFDIFINTESGEIYLDGPMLWNKGNSNNPLDLNKESLGEILQTIKEYIKPSPEENLYAVSGG